MGDVDAGVPSGDPGDDDPERTLHGLQKVLDERPRLAFRLTPVVLFLGLIAASFVLYPLRTRQLGGLYFAYFVPPLGKESVVPLLVGQGFHPLFAAAAIATMDLIGALVVFSNWDLVVRIPVVGRRIEQFSDKVSEVAAEQHVVKAGGWVFLFLFVMFPFQGSGGISGALVSRVLGIAMHRAVAIVGLAAFTSAVVIAYLSEAVITIVGPEVLLVAVAVVATAIGVRTLLSLRSGALEEE